MPSHHRTMDETGWELILATAPTANPITDDEAKEQIRVEHTDDDTHIGLLVDAATKKIEETLGKQLVRATYNLYLDRFPTGRNRIIFPINPVSAITSITYEDEDSASQTWTDGDNGFQKTIAGNDIRATVAPAPDESYPATEANRLRAVNILFNAGYSDSEGNVASIPENYKHALKMYVALLYDYREPVISGTIISPVPDTIMALLGPTSIVEVG